MKDTPPLPRKSPQRNDCSRSFAKRLRQRWPKTYLGFPIYMAEPDQAANAAAGDREEVLRQASAGKERGVSLLIAVMTIVVMVGFISDLIVTSSVQVELSLSSRDKVKSEFLAKSGFNLALFVLSLSHVKDIMMAQPPISTAPHDGPDSVWNIFKTLPPLGASTVDLMLLASKGEEDPFKLKGIMNEKVAEQMRLFEDQFSISVEDENSKINVNDCAKGNCREVLAQMTRLFGCPVEKVFLEGKDISPEELAYRIKDYVHDNTAAPSSQSGITEAAYQEVTPPYGLKNLPFDSVGELKLIPGWDDDVHKVFAPYVSVYQFKQKSTGDVRHILNINTVAPELLACLVPEAKQQGCAEKFAQGIHKLKTDGASIADSEGKIKEKLGELACYAPRTDEGDGVDPAKWFDVYSNIFRIVVKAETGNQQRELEVVVQRFDPGEEKKDNTMKKLKDQRPYRILYWKLI